MDDAVDFVAIVGAIVVIVVVDALDVCGFFICSLLLILCLFETDMGGGTIESLIYMK